jgi:hypothetical protein
MHTGFWRENQKERDHYEDIDIDGTILKLILEKYGGGYGLDSSGSGQRPVAGSYEHGNETSYIYNCINIPSSQTFRSYLSPSNRS